VQALRRRDEDGVVGGAARDQRRVAQRRPRQTDAGQQEDDAVELWRVDVDAFDAPEQAEDEGREDRGLAATAAVRSIRPSS